MKRFATVTGGFAAATVLTAAMGLAQPTVDPMATLAEAPAYDALHPAGVAMPDAAKTPEPGTQAAAPAYDPMAAAAQSEAGTGTGAETNTAAAMGSPNPELGGLPDAPGAEETYYQCIACHSISIVKQQHLSDARWDYLWHWMIEDQGMIPPDDETKETILTYLKQHFSSER